MVEYKWFKIGVQFGIPHRKLKEFEKVEDPLSDVINYCLMGNVEGVPFTWESIVTALESTDESGLAKRLKIKYCHEEEKVDDDGKIPP